MEYSNEEVVTRLLTEKDVMKKPEKISFMSNSIGNLGNFLSKINSKTDKYNKKYIFIK